MTRRPTPKPFPWWIIVIVLVILKLAGFLFWLIRQRRRVFNIDPPIQLEISLPVNPELTNPDRKKTGKSAQKDDFKIIEGIGPKISSVLQQAGITTFQQLASSQVDDLVTILKGAGIRLADPTHWPEQAALAARGDFEHLKKVQDSISVHRPK